MRVSTWRSRGGSSSRCWAVGLREDDDAADDRGVRGTDRWHEGIPLSLFTVIVGHATFCIVVVYNNAVARLRRLSGSFEEASADLGAHTWQTFRLVTLPGMRSALIAGGLLSFDEIIVTNFTIGAGEQTLPIWIFSNLFRPQQLPVVNVVALLTILLSIIPVYLAHRLGGGGVETKATAVP